LFSILKRILPLLGLLLVCAIPSHAAISVGTSWNNSNATGTVTVTASPTNGDTLWVGCGFVGVGATITSFVDNNSAALTQDYFLRAGSNNTVLAYHESNVSGVTSITLTLNAGVTVECIAIDISGLTNSSPLDVAAVAASENNNTPYTSGSITTSNASDIVIGIAFHGSGAYFLTSSAPWTAVAGKSEATALYQIVSSTGAYNPAGVNGSAATLDGGTSSYKALAGTAASTVAGPAKLAGPAKID
jgi:hypothetical protein